MTVGRIRRGLATVVAAALVVTVGPLTQAQAEPEDASTAPGRDDTVLPSGGGQVGDWLVSPVAPGRYEVAWTSPERLPIGSDRPQIVTGDGTPVGLSTVESDGRTVVTTVTGEAPDPTELDVLLSGDRLDETGADVLGKAAAQEKVAPEAPGRTLPEDPATPGPYQPVTSDYRLDPVKVKGMRQPIEMVGHVVEPGADAPGDRPLVLFLHGRHTYCYQGGKNDWSWPCKPPAKEVPSQLGYDYLQRILASQGYATVSIRVNGINAQDDAVADGGASARADIVERHLQHWASMAGEHEVDMKDVVLVGHSRGGEGVNAVSMRAPLTADYRIAGQVLLAPVDFGNSTAPYVPTVSVLPSCDGDVSDLQGQRYVDVGRDMASDDTALKSAVMIYGANHNYFNTEWTPGISAAPSFDDWSAKNGYCGRKSDTRLTARQQRDAGAAVVTGAVHLFAEDEQQFLPMFDGSRARVESQGKATILSSAIGGGRELRRPGPEARIAAGDPAARASLCQGFTSGGTDTSRCGANGAYAPHWPYLGEKVWGRKAAAISWTATGQTGGLTWGEPLDLSDRHLELRTVVAPGSGPVRIKVRLHDASGDTQTFTPEGGVSVAPIPGGASNVRRWARNVQVRPDDAQIDLSAITGVDIVAAGAKGKVWLLDVASAPDVLAPVPDKRMVTASVSNLTVPEGDKPAQGTAKLPIRFSAPLTQPARLRVLVRNHWSYSGGEKLTLSVKPGQRSVEVPISFTRDNLYGGQQGRQKIDVIATPISGLVPAPWSGLLTVEDDEPKPTSTITQRNKRVAEGKPMKFTVKLSGKVGGWWPVQVKFLKAKGRNLLFGDVPKKWRSRNLLPTNAPAGRPLYRGQKVALGEVKKGTRRATITIPTLRDRKREGTEIVKMRVKSGGSEKTLTFRVVDR